MERTVTFTMEDALISPEGFMILSGAGLIEASEEKPIYQHIVETTDEIQIVTTSNKSAILTSMGKTEEDSIIAENDVIIKVDHEPYLPIDKNDNFAYVMAMKNGEVDSEPYIPVHMDTTLPETKDGKQTGKYFIIIKDFHDNYITDDTETIKPGTEGYLGAGYEAKDLTKFAKIDSVLVDYYTPRKSNARQIEITPDKFGGNYYLEASTLFRDTNGVDMPAEFVIPNCKIQSNFTFTMASSGDPSTFTFTMDAFPDYTRFDKTKKVLAAIQVIDLAGSQELYRTSTAHDEAHDKEFI